MPKKRTIKGTEPNPDYDALVAHLRDRYDDGLRWIASFNGTSYRYTVEYIRDDLRTELTSHQLDTVIHRSIGLFNRSYLEKVYTHLGPVEAFVLQHERATAVHLYLGGATGVVIKLRAGVEITLPAFVEACLAALYGRAE
jgi:hypothetical protein